MVYHLFFSSFNRSDEDLPCHQAHNPCCRSHVQSIASGAIGVIYSQQAVVNSTERLAHFGNRSANDIRQQVDELRHDQFAHLDAATLIDTKITYEYYLFDAIMTAAFALHRVLVNASSSIMRYNDEERFQRLVAMLRETDFVGMTGRVRFDGQYNRLLPMSLTQFQGYDKGVVVVGSALANELDTSRYDVLIDREALRWGTSDGKRPSDTKAPSGRREEDDGVALRTTVAIVVIGVLAFVLLLALLAFLFTVQ